MAVVNQWERRVLPQGQLATPREASISETVGAGMQDIGQAGVRLAGVLARAEAVQRQKDDAALLGKLKPQAIIDMDSRLKALDDPESGSFVDAATDAYDGAVNKTIDDYRDETLKSIQSPTARAEMEAYIGQMKARYVVAAGEFSDERKLAKRYADIGEGNRKWGGVLVTAPGKFDEAVAAQEQAIRAQNLRPEKEAEQIAKMRSFMAGYAMNGEASANPGGFLKSASKWVDLGAEPGDIAQAQGIAESELKRQQAEAKAEAARRQAQYRANVGARASDAISSVQNNGGVIPLVNGKPLTSEKEIRSAYADDPIQAQRMVDKLNAATKIGQAKASIQNTTKAEDDQLIASVTPAQGGVFTEDDATVQAAIIGAIKAKRDALANEIEQDITDSQNDAVAQINANRSDWIQAAKVNGAVPDDARVAVAESGSAEARAFLDSLEQQAQLSKADQQIKANPEAANRAMADQLGLDIKATGPGSGERAELAAALQEQVQAKAAAYSGKDPGGAAMTYSTAVSGGWKAYEDADPASAQSAFRNAVSLTDFEQYRQDVPEARRQPMPASVATSIATSIAVLPNPKAQIEALSQYSIPSDPEMTRRVLAQIASTGALPAGIDLVIDAMDPMGTGQMTNTVQAERMLAMLSADTKGINLPQPVKERMDSLLRDGLVGVIAAQAETTGDFAAANALAGPVRAAVEQAAKAKVSLGADPNKAVDEAIADFTGTYAQINNPSIATIYYPKAAEAQMPGALEAGLIALKQDAADKMLAAVPLPSSAVVKDLNLTPQEQFLYQWHVNNTTGQNGGKAVTNPDGSISTVRQAVVTGPDGKFYNVPSLWDGKVHESEKEIVAHAAKIGWDKWPSYATPQEADDRYINQMHPYLDRDANYEPDPYVAATARDIADSAVWINNGGGFALIVPGSTRKLTTTDLKSAQTRGLAAMNSGQVQDPTNPTPPAYGGGFGIGIPGLGVPGDQP